jgi:hypothetical protein
VIALPNSNRLVDRQSSGRCTPLATRKLARMTRPRRLDRGDQAIPVAATSLVAGDLPDRELASKVE